MKEFSKLIKNIEILRHLIREFFVFGYKSRKDFDKKSSRTFDLEKRRVASIFDELCVNDYDKGGKRTSILINSDETESNPLYKVFYAKSFTNNDLVLHFIILDIFSSASVPLSAMEFMELTHKYLPESIDLGTIRIKLNEYAELGILKTGKSGNKIVYQLDKAFNHYRVDWDAICFFAEIDVLGVVGNYILNNRGQCDKALIRYKHRQLFGALDSAYILQIFDAIHKKYQFFITFKEQKVVETKQAVPLKIIINRQNGRQYLAAYILSEQRFFNFRLDHILQVDICKQIIDEEVRSILLRDLQERIAHTWNVNFFKGTKPQKVEMLIYIGNGEEFIVKRLEREGHGGNVIKVDENRILYTISLYDPTEIIPWVKSFIGRIIEFRCEDRTIEEKLYLDMHQLCGECEDEP